MHAGNRLRIPHPRLSFRNESDHLGHCWGFTPVPMEIVEIKVPAPAPGKAPEAVGVTPMPEGRVTWINF
ncbi:hypothetical protein llg_03340 [Luteolibacter sp. LG18]|nr:hypothetical protein llg_03340 [Luteolibacter sp. LG18]